MPGSGSLNHMAALQELHGLIVEHAHGGVRRDLIDGVSIGVVDGTSAPVASTTVPSMNLVAGGRKRTTIGVLDFDCGPGEYLVAALDLPVTGAVRAASIDDPFVVFSLALKPVLIAGLLLDTHTEARAGGLLGLAVSRASDDLLDSVIRLMRVIDRPADLAALGPALEREIVWRLLSGAQGGIVRQIGLADGSLVRLGRAIRWLRENFREPMQVAELAGRSSMSVSSFHRHFRAATSMSPLQFQQALRLREARTRLLAGDGPIADVGFAVGYGSASQFTREYRRAFGVSPGRDAAAIRAI